MPKGIRYQPRDIQLLAEIGEVGIYCERFARRHFPDDRCGKACPKKLRQYVQTGLIEELPLRDATVYRLTALGIDEVERLTSQRPKRAGRGDLPKDDTLLHRLGMIGVRLVFDDACRLAGFDEPQWIMEYDPVPGTKATDPVPRRIVLCDEFQVAGGELVTCWADAAARLRFPTTPPWELVAYFEYDRSTMTHRQMRDKFTAWEQFFAEQAHAKHWPAVGRHIVRLLIICRSEERIGNLAESLAESPLAARIRMATDSSLRPDTLFFEPIWFDAAGQRRAILKQSVADCTSATSRPDDAHQPVRPQGA